VSVRSRRSNSSLKPSRADGTVGACQPERTRGRPLRAALVALFLALIFATATARLFVWPQLPPLPLRADAIIELGGPGDRDGVTLALARQHRAPVVIQSTLASDAKSNTCLPPVPGVTIECFHASPATTRGEARYIGERAVAEHWNSVIIVTTPDHAWRARLRVERCFPGQVYVATSPLPKWDWLRQIPYQWAATVKAEVFQRHC
jgi:uncharacterized SAM-binding protein YcdF (DUF218 family)